MKMYPTLGCCGLDCGLCPRFNTDAASRCPGCKGEGFDAVHPSCGFVTCCVKKKNLEVCGLCGEYPCSRFDKETGERDSFITHRNVRSNQDFIRDHGLEEFLEIQRRRIGILKVLLSQYDDGRSKSFYCLACTLLPVSSLESVLAGFTPEAVEDGASVNVNKSAKALRELFLRSAEQEHIDLALRK